MSDQLPLHVFNDTQASVLQLRPAIKWAVKVPVWEGTVTSLRPEYQTNVPVLFNEDFYLMLDELGRGRYGSAALPWEAMHTQLDLTRLFNGVPACAWVKTARPIGYHVSQHCRLKTRVLTNQGMWEEGAALVEPGELVVRQVYGEVHHIRKKDESGLFFTEDEARSLGLIGLGDDDFRLWMVTQAFRLIESLIVK